MLYYEYIQGEKPNGDKTKIGYKIFKSFNLSRPLRWFGYILGFLLIVAMIFIVTPETRLFGEMDENGQQKRYYPLFFSALYTSLCRPLYVFGLGLLLAGPLVGKGYFLQIFLGSRVYVPWAKLTFYGYMIHLFVFSFYFAQLKEATYLSHPTILWAYIGVIVLTMICALILSIAFESPLLQIERLILFPPKRKPQKQIMEKEELNDPNFESAMRSNNSTKEHQEMKKKLIDE